MKKNQVLLIRVVIAIATFIFLSNKYFATHSYWRYQLFYTGLILIAFATLAIGTSYLINVWTSNFRGLRAITGLISLAVLLFTMIPLRQDSNFFFAWGIVITFTSSVFLIPAVMMLELFESFSPSYLYSLLFSLLAGIFSIFVGSLVAGDAFTSEGGFIILFYGAVLFLVCLIVNVFVVFIKKKEIGGEQ